MKKLKLRGRELKKIGYKNDKAISVAINAVSNHPKRLDKLKVLEDLEALLENPLLYEKHEIYGSVAAALTEKPRPKKNPVKLKAAENLHYNIFGKEFIDDAAIKQMETAMKLPVSVKGALMPDAHSGYGLPIGGVLATYNSVIPYGVGMDIGCRMCMSVYFAPENYIRNNQPLLKNILVKNTRFGKAEFNDLKTHEILERKEFNEIKFLKGLKNTFYAQLGSSGGGNHFIDVGVLEVKEEKTGFDLDPGVYLAFLTHSGSRNFGAQVAREYTRVAAKIRALPKGTTHLAWLNLNEEAGQEYWKAMTLAGDYATANHEIIHQKISKALDMKPIKTIQNHHNFAWKEEINEKEILVIHRKGATPAHLGMLGIVPGSMATPAYVIRGLGNPDSLYSASHGAGRVLSRKKAKATYTQKDLNHVLKKQGVVLLGGGLDEVPMAYKNINTVMKLQEKLVETMAVFYPKIVRMEDC